MVEIDRGVGRPDLLLEFLAGYGLSRVVHQNPENLQWLLLELELDPLLAQLTGPESLAQIHRTE